MQASPSPAPVQCSTPSRPLRVVFLTPSLHMGGAERWILSLAGNFQDGCEAAGVVLCTPHFQRAIVRQAARLMPVYAARRWRRDDRRTHNNEQRGTLARAIASPSSWDGSTR